MSALFCIFEDMEFIDELTGNILPYWMDRMTDPEGGFYGRRDGLGNLVEGSPKGLILNARILWTFASAYRILGGKEYLETATRAKREILDRFADPEYGGAYWSLDGEGRPLDTKKQFYAIAFAIYGLAEYHRATKDAEALDAAIKLFECIEEHSRDRKKGGYIEACTRDWGPIADMRLSDKDRNDAKTMNTHLHILEGYTCLYRVWKDESLREALKSLIEVFLDHICGPDGHLDLFFDEDWKLQGDLQSYGHDIECSWLLWEAAQVLGDAKTTEKVKPVCEKMADAAMEGFTPDGGMIYEFDPETGRLDADRHWWVQAETVVGCWNRFQMSGDEAWKVAAMCEWDFIRRHIICPEGEWYWSAKPEGDGKFTPNLDDDRAGFWKCPYHNGRMCMEMTERCK